MIKDDTLKKKKFLFCLFSIAWFGEKSLRWGSSLRVKLPRSLRETSVPMKRSFPFFPERGSCEMHSRCDVWISIIPIRHAPRNTYFKCRKEPGNKIEDPELKRGSRKSSNCTESNHRRNFRKSFFRYSYYTRV